MSKVTLPEDMAARVSIVVGELTKKETEELEELAKCYLYGGPRNWKSIQALSPRGKLLEWTLLNSLITYLERLSKKEKTREMITAQGKVTTARSVYKKIMPKGKDI